MRRAEILAAGGLAAAALYRQRRPPASTAGEGVRVVILGGGFAGISAARRLGARLPKASVTLVDRDDFHLFTPMLYQVATCAIDPYDIAYPLRQFVRKRTLSFQHAAVEGIDFARRTVHIESGTLDYDYLVIALGSASNFFGNRSAQEHALPLKTLADAMAIRNVLLDNLERASREADSARRRALLSAVIVGGGATGVELAAALTELFRQAIPAEYPHLDAKTVEITLVEGERHLLGGMGSGMAAVARKRLRELGVDLRFGLKASQIEPGRVRLSDGSMIEAQTVIWTAGVEAPASVAQLDLDHAKSGTIRVDTCLRVPTYESVYAAGDCASVLPAGARAPLPMLGAVAVQEGQHIAENIIRAIEGQVLLPFRYTNFGNVVSLGRFHGTVSLGGLTLDGLAGWLAWRLIHLAKNTGFRNQLATVLDWSIGYASQRDLVHLELNPARE